MVLWAITGLIPEQLFLSLGIGAYRMLGVVELFLKHCLMPDIISLQYTDAAHEELIESIRRLAKNKGKISRVKVFKTLKN